MKPQEPTMSRIKQNFFLKLCFTVFLFFLIIDYTFSATKGFDLVVIVDQSGSMMGVRSEARNDPLGVRNDMVLRTFELMAKDGVLNKVTHRLGVVSFGDKVRVDLPLSQITSIDVEKLRKQLDSSLKDESLGNTHFLAAFQEAKKMFTKGPIAAAGKRIIILITDGAPYVEGIQIASYVKELRELIESSFPYPDYHIHIIALNDPSSDYWERYREFWRAVSHNHAIKLEGDKEHIFRALHELINDIVGTSSEHISPLLYDNLVIPPYLESVVFDIFRVDPEVKVEIFPADAPQNPLTPDSGNVKFVNIGKTIQSVSVKQPVPGRWMIRKSEKEARVDIYAQRFFPRGQLINPKADDLIRQYETHFVSYRVVDGDGHPIQEIPGYPLNLELSLVKPDSSRIQVDMRKNPDIGEGVFLTTREIECDMPGHYQTEVLIASRDLNDRNVTIFRDQWSGFDVRSAKLIDCKVLNPQPFERIPVYRPFILFTRPLHFKFRFLDENGQPVNLPAIFLGAETQILQISAAKEEHEDKKHVDLAYKGDGILDGKTDNWNSPGQYRLKIRTNNTHIPSHYTVRVTPSNLVVSRYLNPLHWLQFLVISLVFLALATFGSYGVWLSIRYPLRGILYIDRLGGGQLKEYPLASRRHKITIKELPIQTRLKKIIVRSRRDRRGGIIVTVQDDKKKELLKNRTLADKSQAILSKVPYVLRYKK